jgi:hypothetical protein
VSSIRQELKCVLHMYGAYRPLGIYGGALTSLILCVLFVLDRVYQVVRFRRSSGEEQVRKIMISLIQKCRHSFFAFGRNRTVRDHYAFIE